MSSAPNPSTPEATRPVAEVLRRALESFGPNGEYWAQRGKSRNAPYCCVITAFDRASIQEPIGERARTLLREIRNDPSLVMWNDAPERTFAEVKALFEKAIAKAGSGQ